MPYHTYHCICSTLLLCTPYELSELPRRVDPALDRALILPMGSPNPSKENYSLPLTNGNPLDGASADSPDQDDFDRSILVATKLGPKPLVVTRSDGFEKRWIRKCARCQTVVGYELRSQADGEFHGRQLGKVVYLLEGALRPTGKIQEGDGVGLASQLGEGLS